MKTKINLLNASGKFDSVFHLLEQTSINALVDIQRHIDLPPLDIVISPCSKEYVTELGIVGCVSTPYQIDIMLDADRSDLETIITNELTAVIAHELHHAVRTSTGVAESSLLQTLISEGLACHFEQQFLAKGSDFFDELKNSPWQAYFTQISPKLHDTDFDYPLYFGANKNGQYPSRIGYWIGFNLVSEYINRYGGCAASHIGVSAESILDAIKELS